ncbi:MAG TPA: tRNA lysidine(34) synthetase TilS [Candidatus Saccharimonadales bacterium]
MDVELPTPGVYVVAVSGGVDSVALLNMLHYASGSPYRLVVAHLDHGIRSDSAEDRKLVQATARHLGLPFVFHESRLGAEASEATARQARYDFLRAVRESSGARAVITAHHQDDVLETAIINILRGSGRKGLTALSSRHDIVRPLLKVPKQQLIAYAKNQGLVWREDSTNSNEQYLRNYVRRRIMPRLGEADRQQFLQIISGLHHTNRELDTLLVKYLHFQSVGGILDRREFNGLPHQVAREIMAAWLRANSVKTIDSKMLERLVVAAKTAQSGSLIDIAKGLSMHVKNDTLALQSTER